MRRVDRTAHVARRWRVRSRRRDDRTGRRRCISGSGIGRRRFTSAEITMAAARNGMHTKAKNGRALFRLYHGGVGWRLVLRRKQVCLGRERLRDGSRILRHSIAALVMSEAMMSWVESRLVVVVGEEVPYSLPHHLDHHFEHHPDHHISLSILNNNNIIVPSSNCNFLSTPAVIAICTIMLHVKMRFASALLLYIIWRLGMKWHFGPA
mmetsp:Transcript_32016/g.58659  ORF Transcript_32016/g.58659 Transcript_32016/m.58659 type:complete len:208 (-) Transcript_32016:537-1160(-)